MFLWTFENQTKADPFIALLQGKDIQFEAQAKIKQKDQSGEVTISVDESDYTRAKKILVKHRRRKTDS